MPSIQTFDVPEKHIQGEREEGQGQEEGQGRERHMAQEDNGSCYTIAYHIPVARGFAPLLNYGIQ